MTLGRLGSAEPVQAGWASPPGIDVDAVTDWLQRTISDLEPPIRFSQIIGGRSNLTFLIEDSQGSRWVLRRPPLGHVLATAHDMAREARIMLALRDGPVPVPPVVAVCREESVTGAPFYVMGFVPGTVLRTRAVTERTLGEEQRRTAALALVELLASLHAIFPDHVGLGDLGRPDGYIERQLRRWRTQVAQSQSTILPLVDEVHAKLEGAIPDSSRTSIVHGDFRLDNCIVSDTGSINAVLDWELCTLGDAFADLGLLLVYWSEAGEAVTMLDDAPTTAAGFPSRAEVVEHYSAVAGCHPTDLEFYTAFAYWKLACIVDGVSNRLQAGTMGDSDVSAASYADKAIWLADEAAQAIRQHSRIR